jgi:hypothetical protein
MLLAASAATIIISVSVGPLREEPLTTAAVGFVLLAVLQGAYLAGLMVACSWSQSSFSPARRLVFIAGARRAD